MALSSHWRVEAKALRAEVALSGFAAVRGLVADLMDLADELDHHPEVSFGYSRVSVLWTSHDVDAISDRDWQAAERTDVLFRCHGVVI